MAPLDNQIAELYWAIVDQELPATDGISNDIFDEVKTNLWKAWAAAKALKEQMPEHPGLGMETGIPKLV